jgi:hypothetical protein
VREHRGQRRERRHEALLVVFLRRERGRLLVRRTREREIAPDEVHVAEPLQRIADVSRAHALVDRLRGFQVGGRFLQAP